MLSLYIMYYSSDLTWMSIYAQTTAIRCSTCEYSLSLSILAASRVANITKNITYSYIYIYIINPAICVMPRKSVGNRTYNKICRRTAGHRNTKFS